jgi:hypothetical protein
MTFDEWLEFARDVGRPPDVPVDAETMYRPVHAADDERDIRHVCRLTQAELDAVLAEYRRDAEAEADSTPDAINPDHYKVGGIETIDYMRAKSTPEEFEGYLRLSALKYLSRVGHKHGDHDAARAEEYRKALWFIERLVQECER